MISDSEKESSELVLKLKAAQKRDLKRQQQVRSKGSGSAPCLAAKKKEASEEERGVLR